MASRRICTEYYVLWVGDLRAVWEKNDNSFRCSVGCDIDMLFHAYLCTAGLMSTVMLGTGGDTSAETSPSAAPRVTPYLEAIRNRSPVRDDERVAFFFLRHFFRFTRARCGLAGRMVAGRLSEFSSTKSLRLERNWGE